VGAIAIFFFDLFRKSAVDETEVGVKHVKKWKKIMIRN
jgi:hypothetical protein